MRVRRDKLCKNGINKSFAAKQNIIAYTSLGQEEEKVHEPLCK